MKLHLDNINFQEKVLGLHSRKRKNMKLLRVFEPGNFFSEFCLGRLSQLESIGQTKE